MYELGITYDWCRLLNFYRHYVYMLKHESCRKYVPCVCERVERDIYIERKREWTERMRERGKKRKSNREKE